MIPKDRKRLAEANSPIAEASKRFASVRALSNPVRDSAEVRHRIKVKAGRELVLAAVEGGAGMRPFTYEGRPYERVGSTTRRMPQAQYERLLVERGHAKRRWENLPAEGLALKDLDRKEILRTRELAVQQNRACALRKEIPADYPQCLLKLGRFRGTEVTGEIVDNMVREGMAFLEWTPSGKSSSTP